MEGGCIDKYFYIFIIQEINDELLKRTLDEIDYVEV